MVQIRQHPRKAYVCRTCDVEFHIPRTETAVCCPVCRMNRIVEKRMIRDDSR